MTTHTRPVVVDVGMLGVHLDALSTAAGQWNGRAGVTGPARRAADSAVEAIDAAITELRRVRRQLLGQVRRAEKAAQKVAAQAPATVAQATTTGGTSQRTQVSTLADAGKRVPGAGKSGNSGSPRAKAPFADAGKNPKTDNAVPSAAARPPTVTATVPAEKPPGTTRPRWLTVLTSVPRAVARAGASLLRAAGRLARCCTARPGDPGG